MTALELEPSQPIGPQLHAILRQMVVRNELTPGTRISESEIARKFNISRQPVRETFIKLAEEGLIEIRPQRATVIRKIDPKEVLDARFVREAIEADIVRLLAKTPDAALIAELRQQIEAQKQEALVSASAFIQADERFHRTIAEGAGKGSVWDIIQGMKSQMDRVRFLSFGLFRYDKLIDQHATIIERIEKGDERGAEKATRQHLRAVLDDLPEIMRANPDVFVSDPESATETRSIQRRNP